MCPIVCRRICVEIFRKFTREVEFLEMDECEDGDDSALAHAGFSGRISWTRICRMCLILSLRCVDGPDSAQMHDDDDGDEPNRVSL